MTIEVNVHEAKTHLSKLLHRVMAGEEIIIAKSGKPVARIIPFEQKSASIRVAGSAKGKLFIPDDFDQALPDEIIELFEGE